MRRTSTEGTICCIYRASRATEGTPQKTRTTTFSTSLHYHPSCTSPLFMCSICTYPILFIHSVTCLADSYEPGALTEFSQQEKSPAVATTAPSRSPQSIHQSTCLRRPQPSTMKPSCPAAKTGRGGSTASRGLLDGRTSGSILTRTNSTVPHSRNRSCQRSTNICENSTTLRNAISMNNTTLGKNVVDKVESQFNLLRSTCCPLLT